MSLNIKKEATVALVRELAARTGKTQTAAIEDAVRSKIAELDLDAETARAEQDSRRLTAARLLDELRGSITAAEVAALHAAESEMYDDHGLPR